MDGLGEERGAASAKARRPAPDNECTPATRNATPAHHPEQLGDTGGPRPREHEGHTRREPTLRGTADGRPPSTACTFPRRLLQPNPFPRASPDPHTRPPPRPAEMYFTDGGEGSRADTRDQAACTPHSHARRAGSGPSGRRARAAGGGASPPHWPARTAVPPARSWDVRPRRPRGAARGGRSSRRAGAFTMSHSSVPTSLCLPRASAPRGQRPNASHT